MPKPTTIKATLTINATPANLELILDALNASRYHPDPRRVGNQLVLALGANSTRITVAVKDEDGPIAYKTI